MAAVEEEKVEVEKVEEKKEASSADRFVGTLWNY